MNKLENIQKEDFYISDSSKCTYHPNQHERKLFTFIKSFEDQDFYNYLISKGFRRSQNILYNQICEDCNKCVPIRININNFSFSRNHKRLINKGDIFKRIISKKVTYEQFYLFKKYLEFKHKGSEMNNMIYADYYSMIKNTGIETKVIEYRVKDKLVACCITDVLDDALSMVYSFYSPEFLKYSPGKFMILDHINLNKRFGKELLYLGYWVNGCREMDYKKKFNSSELLINDNWVKND